ASGQTAPDGQLPTIHVPTIADMLGESVVTPIYAIMASEDPAPADAPNAIEAPEIDAGPHLSYAIQWILFAVMGFVFIGYMIRTEIRANREDDTDDDEDDEDDLDDLPPRRKPRARRPKRRDRDADAEDAILDAI
ncbi:MAG: SURF1 family cytochrome oxidase biogenesis protein, partial [Microbacterium gubbeenense]